jgi:hypothetical protein
VLASRAVGRALFLDERQTLYRVGSEDLDPPSRLAVLHHHHLPYPGTVPKIGIGCVERYGVCHARDWKITWLACKPSGFVRWYCAILVWMVGRLVASVRCDAVGHAVAPPSMRCATLRVLRSIVSSRPRRCARERFLPLCST